MDAIDKALCKALESMVVNGQAFNRFANKLHTSDHTESNAYLTKFYKIDDMADDIYNSTYEILQAHREYWKAHIDLLNEVEERGIIKE